VPVLEDANRKVLVGLSAGDAVRSLQREVDAPSARLARGSGFPLLRGRSRTWPTWVLRGRREADTRW